MGKTHQTIEIDAALEDVWAKVSDFHNLDWASGVMASCEVVGGLGSREMGAKRLLNGVIRETLLELDSEQHLMRYSIDEGPSPIAPSEVSDYVVAEPPLGLLHSSSTARGLVLLVVVAAFSGNPQSGTKCSPYP